MADPCWSLTPGVRRVGDGRVLIGGSPATLMRLTEAGSAALDRALAPVGAPTDAGGRSLEPDASTSRQRPPAGAEAALLARLERRGLLAATPPPLSPDELSELWRSVTVVVPVRDDGDGLRALLGSLAGSPEAAGGSLQAPGSERSGRAGGAPPCRVVVVDDGSRLPDEAAAVAQRFGAELIRRPRSGGPAAARITGLDVVDTPLVVFLDADVRVTPGWLAAAGAHFRTAGRLAVVAPRVAAGRAPQPRHGSAWSAYEQDHSPLDLGPHGGAVAPGTRLAYVPSAAWVARADALRSVGGFDPALRYGEDVDLVWRLVEAGWSVRYEARAVVHHRMRNGVVAGAVQRFRYGTSAAPLAVRHPGALAPVATSSWSAAAWALAALGHPVAGIGVAAGSTAQLARRLTVTNPGAEALRLAGRGHLAAGPQLARALIRPWWPVTALLALTLRRTRVPALFGLLASAAGGWRGTARPVVGALAVADDVAYSAGVWWGLGGQLRRDPAQAGAALGAVVPRLSGGFARGWRRRLRGFAPRRD
ncbi:MAG: mycofactocin biosynthesis glycosyltransferase MftF [Microthrixaceae bacterium]